MHAANVLALTQVMLTGRKLLIYSEAPHLTFISQTEIAEKRSPQFQSRIRYPDVILPLAQSHFKVLARS